ncbi:hypothetical protein BDY21DRAFT_102988 [Lineolata rhizophorae]|uniref:HOOK N-terminal domain-containing protein n=1 Tax=Lineolata rhizophorae TaxID=578093 RepID=A0A6A6NRI2_9PEZI|nr:hypothetical protein BDY21DRAFT_102988 [Lineolata rhizophorae]
MEGTPPRSAEAAAIDTKGALMQWLNTFDLGGATVRDWRDLSDGRLLWRVLRDIDPAYFHGDLPEPDPAAAADNWIPRWQNLKFIARTVTHFIPAETGKFQNLVKYMAPDLKAIAIDGAQPPAIELIKLVLLAALYSDRSNTRMVEVLQKLGPRVASKIAEMVRDIEAQEARLAENADQDGVHAGSSEPDLPPPRSSSSSDGPFGRGPAFERDPVLELEERLIKMGKENHEQALEIDRLTGELDEARQLSRHLEEELVESQLQLDSKGSGARGADGHHVEEIERQLRSSQDYIDQLEADLGNYRSRCESQARELERLKVDEATKQELRDNLQEVRTERDELLQKAKANENLKKKIQRLADQELINQRLRGELDEVRERLGDLDKLQADYANLQKVHSESMQALSSVEQENYDQKTQRTRVEFQLKQQEIKNEHLLNELNKAQEELAEHRKGREDGAGAGGAGGLGSLDDELAASEEREQTQDARKEGGAPPESPNVVLLQQKAQRSSHLEARVKSLEEQYLKVYTDNLGLQAALDNADEGVTKSDSYVAVRKQLDDTKQELSKLRTDHHALLAENSELKHRLVKLTPGDEADVGDYRSLKGNHEELLARFRRVQEYSRGLEGERDEQRAILRHILLARNNLLGDDESDAAGLLERPVVEQQVGFLLEAAEAERVAVKTQVVDSLAGMLAKGREDIAELKNKRQDDEIAMAALREKLEAAEKGAGEKGQAEMQRALERETRLVAAAFYDLSSRMQSASIVLQRRGDGPRSWLGRQRLAVAQVGGGAVGRK